jgi:two-component system, OmpR family, sensor histidine kinase VicK
MKVLANPSSSAPETAHLPLSLPHEHDGDPAAPQPEEIRRMAEEYYQDFRPAIGLYEEDQEGGGTAFEDASDRGLVRIDKMAQAGEELDELGEQLSEQSLAEVERATKTARVVLLAVIFGLLLVGAGLAYLAVRVVNELRRLYAERQAATEKLEARTRRYPEPSSPRPRRQNWPETGLSSRRRE